MRSVPTVLTMTLLSDGVGSSRGGICAPHDLPPDSPYARGGEHALITGAHIPGDTSGLIRVIEELRSIASDVSRLSVRWEGRASREYEHAWDGVHRDVKALSRELEQVDVIRGRRLRGMQSDWLQHRAQASAAGEAPGPPPYPWMR